MSESTQWDMEGEAKKHASDPWHCPIGSEKYRSFPVVSEKRLALAEILMQPCDILVLDEPTNHLDHAMATWLEDYLKTLARQPDHGNS